MDSLILATNVVLPLIILIGIGYGTQSLHWISNEAYQQMNKLVFNVLLPCHLFNTVYGGKFEEMINVRLIIYSVITICAVFSIGIFIAKAWTKNNKKRGVVLQSLFRSNFVLFGIPIVQSVYGDNIGATAVLIMVIVPVFNILAVISLEMFRSGKINFRSIIANICKNPLILSTALGILLTILDVPIPALLHKSIKDIAVTATPIALIVLGGTFQKQSIGDNMRLLLSMSAIKLFISPLIFLGLALPLGFRNVEILSLVALYGSPAAVSSYTMAHMMEGDSELAGQHVLISTVLSIFSIFFWVFILSWFSFVRPF